MGKEKTHSSFSLFAKTVGNVKTCYLVLGHMWHQILQDAVNYPVTDQLEASVALI